MINTLIVVPGPTAVGKTALSVKIAETLRCEIISADSRQFYKPLKIGVAAPGNEELIKVKHHFIAHLNLWDKYNVSGFEQDVIEFLSVYFTQHRYALLVGGSGLYIDAVCKGIDYLPDADPVIRNRLKEESTRFGLENIRKQLKQLDPEYYSAVDIDNPNRLLRALEVCLMTGKTYSSFRNNRVKKRSFKILKIGINRPRPELFSIIDQRVDKMIADGLVDETRNLLPYRHLNALNTVGYKEIFKHLDNTWTLDLAIEKIKTNTRRYAKRQLTWFKKDPDIHWFHPDDLEKILEFIERESSVEFTSSD